MKKYIVALACACLLMGCMGGVLSSMVTTTPFVNEGSTEAARAFVLGTAVFQLTFQTQKDRLGEDTAMLAAMAASNLALKARFGRDPRNAMMPKYTYQRLLAQAQEGTIITLDDNLRELVMVAQLFFKDNGRPSGLDFLTALSQAQAAYLAYVGLPVFSSDVPPVVLQ